MTVKIESNTGPSRLSSSHRNSITIKLIDEESLHNLYISELDESSFHIFREQQSLRYDFSSLPQVLSSLLEKTLRDQDFPCDPNTPTNYIELFNDGLNSSILSIKQRTEYRDHIEIQIPFKKADSDYVKKYLSEKLKQAN